LQQIGCGEYVPGRHGHPSRFVWNKEYGSLSICRAAFGEELSPAQELLSEDEDMTYEEEQIKSEEELLYHHFNLRVDYQLEFTLPVDLTICEAERLSAFIKCLPLEDF
jgi:hypothetical protein